MKEVIRKKASEVLTQENMKKVLSFFEKDAPKGGFYPAKYLDNGKIMEQVQYFDGKLYFYREWTSIKCVPCFEMDEMIPRYQENVKDIDFLIFANSAHNTSIYNAFTPNELATILYDQFIDDAEQN